MSGWVVSEQVRVGTFRNQFRGRKRDSFLDVQWSHPHSDWAQKDCLQGGAKSNLSTSVSMDTSSSGQCSEGMPHLIHQHTHTHTHHIAPLPAAGSVHLRPVAGGQYLPVVATAGGSGYPTITPAKQFSDPGEWEGD